MSSVLPLPQPTEGAADRLTEAAARAERDKERVVLIRDGKPVAAVVPIEDLEALEAEDEYWSRAADEAIGEWEAAGRHSDRGYGARSRRRPDGRSRRRTLTWRIEFLPSARAELLALDRPVQARILRSLHRLAAAPRSAANVKALKGNARYRLRVGDWRVIYTLLDDVLVVLVVRIAHRREAYR